MSNELAVSVYFGFHDSSVAVADAQRVLVHLESERYFRRKHHAASADEMIRLIMAALHFLDRDENDIGKLYVSMLNNQFPPGDLRIGRRTIRPVFTRHHECHIGTVLDHGSERAVIVCADGGSEDGTTRVYRQQGDTIECIDNLDGTPMTGKFYGTLTQLVIDPDFKKAHAFYPGKTMGLAAYGRRRDDLYAAFASRADELSRHWETPDRFRSDFGLSAEYSNPWLDQLRCDVARNGQEFWADRFFEKLGSYRDVADTLVLVGGCALNVLLNSRIADSKLFRRVHTGPVAGDCGQSVGGLVYHDRKLICEWPYLGRGFGDLHRVPGRLIDDLRAMRIVAWYQGRSESGPRGLGHRSFLGLPSSSEMRDRMNALKGREPYRPVAPIVAAEDLGVYFETNYPSPYMTFSPRAQPITQAICPAIVHVDGTSRIQTLTAAQNPVLYDVLQQLKGLALPPILMNSSFNVAGEPIVDTPDDALRSFQLSQADVLYVNGERISKKLNATNERRTSS